jgi:hypothetical protein
MMGENVDDKTLPPKRNRITALPVKRKKSSIPITPRIQQALGRAENIANNDEARKKAISETVAKKKKLEEKRRKAIAVKKESIGNTSSYPKNVIFYEDTAPIINLFPELYPLIDGERKNLYRSEGIGGEDLQAKEIELLKSKNKFTRETILLYYCLNLLSQAGKTMNLTHIYPHDKFGKPIKTANEIRKEIDTPEKSNPHHFTTNPFPTPRSSTQLNPLNKPNDLVLNTHAYFFDTDGLGFDEFVTTQTLFEPLKISCTVNAIENFFHSAEMWSKGKEKFVGVIHPNAEKVKFSGYNITATQEIMNTHTKCTALGYGYHLPQAYRKGWREPNSGPKHTPLSLFIDMFEDDISSRLQKSMSSNCNDLMENYNDSPEDTPYPKTSSYCENQHVATYISKATKWQKRGPNNNKNPNWSELKDICNKVKPDMVKDVFTKTNFVTLYKVTKVDNKHITIEKETFNETANKSLEKRLDEMIARLKN